VTSYASQWALAIALLAPAAPLFAACDALKPFAGGSTVYTHDQLVERGRHVFEQNCAVCHGMDASGGRGPNLRRAHIARAPDEAALCDLIETGIPPEMPDGGFMTDEDVREVVAFVRSVGRSAATAVTGDAAHGARVFAAGGCAACHILAGAGKGFGPELTDLGDRRSAAYVRQVLLDPPSRLPAEFLMLRATSRSGAAVEGIRVNEDDFSVQLKDAAGNFHSFDKAGLASLERLEGRTPMPSFAKLPPADLDDLIAFLLAPRAAP
jgi:putative heme-binding domain-containing protein